MLYGDLDIESIKQGKSKIRNKGIAEIFNRMKIIEEWGTGINRIISGCREYGLLEPEFSELGDSFRVNIFRKTTLKTTADQNAKKLTDMQKKLVSLIQSDAKISKEKMMKKLGLTEYKIKSEIKALRNAEIIDREGGSKGRWIIK